MLYNKLVSTNILFLTLFLFFINFCEAQLLTLASKDSLNNKPKKEFYITAWLKLNGIMDYQGISNTSAMNLTLIPTDGSNPDPHFTMDMYQTRIKLASTFQTLKLGEIFSFIETDFYGGNGGGLRMRHAYIRFLNFRIGQTWSGFTDEEAWPNITDFDGPSTGAWVRQTQFTYFIRPSKSEDILIAFETPMQDFNRYIELDTTITSGNPSLPDFTTHYEKRWGKNHFQVAAVARVFKYKNEANRVNYEPGYGFNISGKNILYKRDNIVWQAIWGKGISRYLVSFGGGGWDALPDTQGNLVALPVYGGYFGYQHFWGSTAMSSTFVYGYAAVDNPFDLPNDHLFTGSYVSGNIYWQPIGPLNFALEFIYGNRRDEFGNYGDNIRGQFVFEYNF
ncbi:DcaP family trimeric outer membrane transporter [Flexithrix dorotheae]|uniref:DcaP family trimeric outer membrane transporter n=1 Tax=Flexithrix dorotheae TaxID=70993 RepID=UPI0003691AB1|nr:DcaP family trimeric outer membrane transporter [Flexithrix dorotheae]